MEEQYENIVLGPRYGIRVQNLCDWHALNISCCACDHVGLVRSVTLRKRWPGHARLVDLEKWMRCLACGNGRDNAWRVVKLPR